MLNPIQHDGNFSGTNQWQAFQTPKSTRPDHLVIVLVPPRALSI